MNFKERSTGEQSIIIIVCFIAIITLFRVITYQTQKYHYKNAEYEGKVDSKYIDSMDKHIPKVNLLKPNGDYIDDIWMGNYHIFPSISIGDIIIKKKGNLEFILIHNNDTTLFYPEL